MKNEFEFQDFPKMARLTRECIITEKLDGTNAQIMIADLNDPMFREFNDTNPTFQFVEVNGLAVTAASRSRYIHPKDDNYGFAKWVWANAEDLAQLGPGRHFGEWWGQGIQRNYGMTEKKFSLFNVTRWAETRPTCCDVVPTLYRGNFSTEVVLGWLEELRLHGSVAVPGFMNPEGVVVYHVAAGVGFKKTLEKDELPKSLAGI